MKKMLLVLLIALLSAASAQAAPKGNPPGHAGDFICFAPWFSTSKWCRKYNKTRGL